MPEDRDAFEKFASSAELSSAEAVLPRALHVKFRDSLGNLMRVELFCVSFQNSACRGCPRAPMMGFAGVAGAVCPAPRPAGAAPEGRNPVPHGGAVCDHAHGAGGGLSRPHACRDPGPQCALLARERPVSDSPPVRGAPGGRPGGPAEERVGGVQGAAIGVNHSRAQPGPGRQDAPFGSGAGPRQLGPQRERPGAGEPVRAAERRAQRGVIRLFAAPAPLTSGRRSGVARVPLGRRAVGATGAPRGRWSVPDRSAYVEAER